MAAGAYFYFGKTDRAPATVQWPTPCVDYIAIIGCLWQCRGDTTFHAITAMMAPTNGPTTIIQKSWNAPGQNTAGPEAARGVYRAVVDRDSHDVDQSEGEADADTGKFAPSHIGVSGPEDYEHEEECRSASISSAMPDVAPGCSTLVARL